MRAMRIIGVGGTCGLALTLVTVLPAQAKVPKCFGKRATIIGTTGSDRLEGTPGPDVIVGLGGQDLILGGRGDDLICGNSNPSGRPFQELYGERGKDKLKGGSERDYVVGGAGNDVLMGRKGRDGIAGDAGDDRSLGGEGRDYMPEGDGNDIVRGGQGADHLEGGFGKDAVFGDYGDDYVIGGDGRDHLNGGRDSDVLAGADGDDVLKGGQGRDAAEYLWVYFSSGFRNHRKDIAVDLRKGKASGMGRDSVAGIEMVWTGGGKDTLIGNSRNNIFYIGTTGEGADHDYIDGRAGSDTLTFDSSSIEGLCCSSVSVDLASGSGTWGGIGFSFRAIENLIGSGNPDHLLGDSNDNVLRAGGGRFSENDTIRGRGGRDRLVGLAGDDRLAGGLGSDRLFGNSGSDLLNGNGGRNSNNGGRGSDQCLNPTTAEGAVSCES